MEMTTVKAPKFTGPTRMFDCAFCASKTVQAHSDQGWICSECGHDEVVAQLKADARRPHAWAMVLSESEAREMWQLISKAWDASYKLWGYVASKAPGVCDDLRDMTTELNDLLDDLNTVERH